MRQVTRVKAHVTVEDIDQQLKPETTLWRIRRWRIIRHALVAPAPAQEMALPLGVSLFTVRTVIQRYNRYGPAALATPGKGQRQRAYLRLADEQAFLAPFLEKSRLGQLGLLHDIKMAFEKQLGRTVAYSTITRLLRRHHWRKGVPRPRHPGSSPEVQAAFKKPFALTSNVWLPPGLRQIPGRS
jgi:transposase